jgi:hypothetical protein
MILPASGHRPGAEFLDGADADSPVPARSLPALQLAVFDHLLDGTQRQAQTLGGFGRTAIFLFRVSGVTAMGQSDRKCKVTMMVSV